MNKPCSLQEIEVVYNRYKKFVWKEIPKETKVNWKIKEMGFDLWERDYWGGNTTTIYIGNYYKPRSKILTSIIHEAIHLNTINEKTAKVLSGSKERAQAREIATCILTNMIIMRLNKKFNRKFRKNRFDRWYKEYEHLEKKFYSEKKAKNFYDFCELVKERIK